MKLFFAVIVAGFAASTAMAGDKAVIYHVYNLGDPSVFYTLNTSVPGGVLEMASVGSQATSTTSAASGNTVIQTGITQSNENAVYAQLLAEAKKRGLR